MPRLFTNNASTTLVTGITSASTSITLASGTGAQFPSPTDGNFFILTLTQGSTETSWEDVKVIGRSGDILTVSERGYGGSTAAAWAAGSKAEIRLTADAAYNGANALCPDASGNIYANIVPRTGTLSSLLSLAGGVGELSCATDADAIVKHNGVAGQAKAFYAGGGLVLFNNTAITNDTITCTGYGELILAATSPTALSIVLPQSPTNGQKFALRMSGALTATCVISIYADAAKTVTLLVLNAGAGAASDIIFEYSTSLSEWAVRDVNGPRSFQGISGDHFLTPTTFTSTGLTTGTVLNLGSYAITPLNSIIGVQVNYLVVAFINFTMGAGAVLNNAGVCISPVSGDYVTGNSNKPKVNIQGPVANSADPVEVMVMSRLMSINSTAATTRYINVKANFSGGTVNAAGYAYAIRM